MSSNQSSPTNTDSLSPSTVLRYHSSHNKVHRKRGTDILIQQTTDPTMWFSTTSIPDDASLPSTYVPAATLETTVAASIGVEEEEEEEEMYLEGIEKLIHSRPVQLRHRHSQRCPRRTLSGTGSRQGHRKALQCHCLGRVRCPGPSTG
jgi:hypothetical protein